MLCLRCKKKMKKATVSGLGPDCEKKGRKEAEAFCQKLNNETLDEFFDDCDRDFAGDADQTLEEYQAINGRSAENLSFAYDTLMSHGLWQFKPKRR